MFDVLLQNLKCYHFVSREIKSNMFIFLHDDEALIIDPHYNNEAMNLLKNKGIKRAVILLTHEHPDHTFGLPFLMDFLECKIICQKQTSLFLSDKNNNRPTLILFMLSQQDEMFGSNLAEEFKKNYREYAYNATITFEKEYFFEWSSHFFYMRSIPGHSPGSCCIIINDNFLCSGDSLLPDYPVITRFPGGNTKEYKEKTLPYLSSLDKNLILLPGHGRICRLFEVLKGE